MSSRRKSVLDKSPLNVDSLAWGTAYAMEQAWHLLRDAVLLIQQQRYASSLALATFCLEELVRAQIYRESAQGAFAGKRITLSSLGRDLRDHVAKLSRAEIPVTVALASPGGPPATGSAEEREMAERLAAARKTRDKEAPRKALDDRMRALYVDRIQRVPGWNRPCKVITQDDADFYVGAAEEGYRRLRDDLERDSSEAGKKIWARVQRLELPEPPWDVWTWEEQVSQ